MSGLLLYVLGSRLGHELLTIIIRYALILVSTLDPGSPVFGPRKGQKTWLCLSSLPEMCAGTFLPKHRQNIPRCCGVYFVSVLGSRLGRSRGYFVSLRHKISHSLNPHSSRSSAKGLRASPRLGSSLLPSYKRQRPESFRFRVGLLCLGAGSNC